MLKIPIQITKLNPKLNSPTEVPLKFKSNQQKCNITIKPQLNIWAMVNTHYMIDGHPIHNKDPYNGYYNPYKPLDD